MSGRNRRLPSSFPFVSNFRSLLTLALLVVAFVSVNYFFFGGGGGGAASRSHNESGISPMNSNDHNNKSFLRAHAFNENNVARNAKRLIIVAGHSVTVSGHLHDADHDEEDWFLLDYQKRQGLPEAIIAHIKAGIEAVTTDPTSLLLFSGGETRAQTGPDTEGASYFRVADAQDLWQQVLNNTTNAGGSDTLLPARSRTASEDFARDSLENLYV
jgi:hypothetical protein